MENFIFCVVQDIYELAELFLVNVIGLSVMVVLSESCVQNFEYKAIAEALTLNLAPKMYRQ